jgi:glycerate 2-kinase
MLFDNDASLTMNGLTPQRRQKRADVLGILRAAVDVVDPYRLCEMLVADRKIVVDEETFDLSLFHRVFLVAFGKASLGMSRAICEKLQVAGGVIISPFPGVSPADSVSVFVGGHPLPTQESIRGTEKVLELLDACGPDDCVLMCISGGGSSLLVKPRVPLDDLQRFTAQLLASGATIEELNIVRKHLCEVKGGQLAARTKATVVSLIISDVIGDPVHSIASGPTAPDPSSFEDAIEVLKKYRLWKTAPSSVRVCLSQGLSGEIPETPKPGDPCFSRVKNYIIANNLIACQAAAAAAMERGYSAVVISTSMSGEAREVGRLLVQNAKENKITSIALIAGGETTVTVTGSGKGGRNQEIVLGAVCELAGTDIVFGSCATDGIDGRSPAAGALADGDTLARAQKKGLDPQESLAKNDAFTFFSGLGDALMSGPTGTNVMDIQVLVC